MKILILLSASLFGFGLVSQHVTDVVEPPVVTTASYTATEEPVATIALDTITIVYEAPASLADSGL